MNCEISLILTFPDKCTLFKDAKATTFAITDTKVYVPVVNLSTQGNSKLLQLLKSGLKEQLIGTNVNQKQQ